MHMHFCENQVIDSVISYYCALAERNTIPFHVQIDLPAQISVDETDFCLVLSNLLENALEASLKTAKFRQRIDIKIYRHASNLILIQIENAFDGKMICPLSSRQVKYLKVSDKNTYISFWSVGIFMHTISLYIF